jgi:hypothetical protein
MRNQKQGPVLQGFLYAFTAPKSSGSIFLV